MPNLGTLEVTLLDVTGASARDPDTRLTIRRGSSQDIVKVFRTSLPPNRQFELPAFPDENVLAPFMEPSRFRPKPLPFFILTNGKTVVRNVTAFREPSEWKEEHEVECARRTVRCDEKGAGTLSRPSRPRRRLVRLVLR